MISVEFTEPVTRELVAEIDTEEFLEWSGGLPVTSDLLTEYLSSAQVSWQEELQMMTGHRVHADAEIIRVKHW